MKKSVTFFLLQLKRTSRALPFVLIVSLCICLALGTILNHIILEDNSQEDKQKFTIAIVGDANDSYLGFGISALQSMDISRYMVELVEMTESEARQSIEKGKIAAYVIIPDGFVDAIIQGEVLQLTYVTTNSSIGITSIFKDEMLSAISCMLVESQNGVYGMQYAMDDNGIYDGFWEHTDKLNIEYFNLILSRSLTYKEEIIGVSDQLSFSGYMLSGISVLMIFLCGISCCPLFVKKDMALPKLLCVSGHSPLSQVFGEYAAYFILMFSNILVILVTVFFALGDTVSIIPELYDYTALDAALLVIKFIPGIIMITSLQYLLYEISSSIVSGVLLQFISSIALTYAGGCFYPISFFPEGIQKLAKFLPSGIARSYLSECITSEQTASAGAIIILVSVLFIGLAVVVRKYRITQK